MEKRYKVVTWSPSELAVCNGGGSRQSNQVPNLYVHFTRKKLPFPTPKSQLKNVTEPSTVLLILIMQYSLFPSLFNYSQNLLYRHPLNIDISLFNGQFALSIGKESPHIFSKFNLLIFNTDTPLIRILSMAPSVSILTGLTVFCSHSV